MQYLRTVDLGAFNYNLYQNGAGFFAELFHKGKLIGKFGRASVAGIEKSISKFVRGEI